MKHSESSQSESDGAPISRIEYVRRACGVTRTSSRDGSVNRDSLLYLARFVAGESTNLFHVSGAIRCSGSTPEQLARIVELLATTAPELVQADVFVEQVEKRLSTPVLPMQPFPMPPRRSTEEDALRAEEFDRTMQAQARAIREQAQEDEKLDRAIADLMGVSVVKNDDEWGWKRQDTGQRYSPTSDSALAFELIEHFHLDIAFHTGDGAVTFHVARYDPDSYSVYASNYGGSLARAIAVAAYRKAVLERRVR